MADNKYSDSRRQILKGSLALGAAALAGNSLADHGVQMNHHHHEHKKNPYGDLIESAYDCMQKSQLCLDHCIELVKGGDITIADCMASVSEMIPMCDALGKLASYQSQHLQAFAKVCMDVCQSCEDECRKHEEHPECKACAESCAECKKECEKIV